MTISVALEMGIGLAVVYYIVGLIVSFITTQFSTAFEMRGRDVYKTLSQALDDKLDDFTSKKIITSLKPPKISFFTLLVRWARKLLRFQPAKVFEDFPSSALATALLDGVNINNGAGVGAVNQIINAGFAGIQTQASAIDQNIIQLKQNAQKNIETWLDQVIANGSARYKENIRRVVILVSLIVTIGLNVDSIAIGKFFWSQPVARELASKQADEILSKSRDTNGEINIDTYEAELAKLAYLKIPIWWGENAMPNWKTDTGDFFLKVAGWIITWAAVSQGSSFWYDTLKKLKSYNAKAASDGSEAGV